MEEKVIEYPNINNMDFDKNEMSQYINTKLDGMIYSKYMKEKGRIYEIYIKKYLINIEHLECWLWKDIPKNILIDSKLITNDRYNYIINTIDKLKDSNIKDANYYKHMININHINKMYDYGIDILAKKDNKYIFIQCKNFNTTIYNSRLNSFNNIMNRYKSNDGILYYSGNLHVTKLNNVKYIHIPFNTKDLHEEITFDIYTNSKIYQKIEDEYIQKIYKENMKRYVNYKKNNDIPDNNNPFYSEIKWYYILDELDSYLKINKKLPEGNTISDISLLNFINHNEKIIHCYTQKWIEFKEIYSNIFMIHSKVTINII